MNPKFRTKLNQKNNLFCYFIIVTILPSILCAHELNNNSDSASIISSSSSSSSSNDGGRAAVKKPQQEQQHGRTEVKDSNRLDEDLPQHQLYAGYHESYITKDAARKFRQRVRSHKKPYTDRDYDDFIQEIDFKPKHHNKESTSGDIYDKKYFDYLPAEEATADEKKLYRKREHGKLSLKKFHNGRKRINSRRMRRDTSKMEKLIMAGGDDEKKKVDKRYTSVYATHQFIRHERQQPSAPGGGYYYPVPQIQFVPAPINPNNPWNNKYYGENRPMVNNWYLPVPQPSPNSIYPNNYYNVPHPPVNPPGKRPMVIPQQPNRDRPTSNTGMNFNDRFGAEDDRVIWDIQDNLGPQSFLPQSVPQASFSPTRAPVTRRPAPNLIRGEGNRNRPSTTERPQFVQTPSPPPQQSVTRRPAPPLVREQGNKNNNNNNNNRPVVVQRPTETQSGQNFGQSNNFNSNGNSIRPTQRPTEFVPVQSFNQGFSSNNNNNNQGQSFPQDNSILGPPYEPPRPKAPENQEGPSRCVWSIVNCCKRGNRAVRYSCFEQMGCGGAFWDLNPCSDDILNAALEETNRYFN